MRHLKTLLAPTLLMITMFWAMFFSIAPMMPAGAHSPATAPRLAASTAPATWTTYHHDNQRSGYDAQQPAFSGTIAPAWAAPASVDGAVYAEPLVTGNMVIVATENNSIYALDAATGATLWHANLGPAVPGSSLPCGNISTVGITSTPVVDATAGIIYVVGLVQPSGQAMRHVFAAIDLSTGTVLFQQTITVSGLNPQQHLQRGALTLLNGTVYVPFGGNYGDCTPYHGWLVGMPTSGNGSPIAFQTSTNDGGGFWQPAGASVDLSGNLYDTSGNTFCGSPCTYDGGETVFKLSSSLQELDYFAPSNFATLDANDLDLGSTDPLPVNGGLLFQVGKTGDGFLLLQSGLGHVGGQAYTAHVCPNLTDDAAFGGDAYVDPYIYVPCRNHLVALTLNSSTPSFALAWQGPSVSYAGPPIVAGGLVWTLDPSGTLYALNPTTGATVYSYNVGGAAHFATPSAGDGYVFAAGANKVYAFQSASSTSPYIQVSPSAVSLTTTPGSSPGPQMLTLSNAGGAPLNWSSGALPAWVSVSPSSGLILGGNTQMLTLTFNTPSTTPQTYSTNLVLTDPNAANSPVSLPITVVSSNVSTTWYFAEGYTGGSFQTWLTLANPNALANRVQVTYLLDGGRPPVVRTYGLAPTSRFTLLVNNEIGNGNNVSIVVNAQWPVIAERPMYFYYTGLAGYTIPGGTDVLGATSLSQSFDFGYLDTTGGHDTYLTILNQNPGPNPMTVTINYYPAAGGAPIQRVHQVAPKSRGTVKVSDDVPSGSYSALISLDAPGLVERPLYQQDSITEADGSADVVGVATPLADWDFAEGYTASSFSERYIVSNPNASGTAHVTVTFFLSTGSTQTAQVSLNPGQQQVIDANGVLGSGGVNNSAHVHADLPILAERFMSFNYTGPVGSQSTSFIPGATDVLGSSSPSQAFYFAEGYTGGSFGEWLTIENPNSTQATVTVTYLPANGAAPKVVTYSVHASSRFTVLTNQVMGNQSFSMVVTSDLTILAERPMYFAYTGTGGDVYQTGGTDVIGYQP